MRYRFPSRVTETTGIIATLVLAISLTGCTLLGLGAAAGTVVGGCALLDEDQNQEVTEPELAAGIHNAWDANDDGVLTEAEFDAGVQTRDRYSDWSGQFDDWDTNDDDAISQAEFQTGVANTAGTRAWLDDECDDLGL